MSLYNLTSTTTGVHSPWKGVTLQPYKHYNGSSQPLEGCHFTTLQALQREFTAPGRVSLYNLTSTTTGVHSPWKGVTLQPYKHYNGSSQPLEGCHFTTLQALQREFTAPGRVSLYNLTSTTTGVHSPWKGVTLQPYKHYNGSSQPLEGCHFTTLQALQREFTAPGRVSLYNLTSTTTGVRSPWKGDTLQALQREFAAPGRVSLYKHYNGSSQPLEGCHFTTLQALQREFTAPGRVSLYKHYNGS